MKSKFTSVWAIFFGLLIYLISSGSAGRVTGTTTTAKDIRTTTTTLGDPKSCSGGDCHKQAFNDIGGKMFLEVINFPSSVVPGETYHIVFKTFYTGTITSKPLIPSLQISLFSLDSSVDPGVILNQPTNDFEVNNRIYQKFATENIITYLERSSQSASELFAGIDWKVPITTLIGTEIKCRVGCMYRQEGSFNPITPDFDNSWSTQEIVKTAIVSTSPNCTTQPDLTLQKYQDLPTMTPGSTATFELNVLNNGIKSAKSSVINCYLSSDPILDTGDALVGIIGVNDLPTGGKPRLEGAFTLPFNASLGLRYIICQADGNKEITECDETNNTLVLPFMLMAQNSYCVSKSQTASFEWIKSVKIGNNEQQSGKGQYSERLYLDHHFKKGTNLEVNLTAGFGSNNATTYWQIWADWNQDNQFSTDELVLSKQLNKPANGITAASIAGNISVPWNAKNGYTRFRVAMKNSGFSTACETFTRGEVEDYVFNIVDFLQIGDRETDVLSEKLSTNFSIFPNPATEGTTLDLADFSGKNVEITAFDLNGKVVFKQKITDLSNQFVPIETATWSPGVFTIFVKADDFRPISKKLIVTKL
jgi:hypothetical protein